VGGVFFLIVVVMPWAFTLLHTLYTLLWRYLLLGGGLLASGQMDGWDGMGWDGWKKIGFRLID